jgi:hypothetical protein
MNLNLKWIKSKNARWNNELTLLAGKVKVANCLRSISNSMGTPENDIKYIMTIHLPQIGKNERIEFIYKDIEEIKTKIERIVTNWFDACSYIEEIKRETE